MIPGLPLDLSNPFSWGLACATLHPGLRSILVYNCQPIVLQTAATKLSQMLREVDRREVIIIHLGPSETEDDLWGTLSLHQSSKAPSFAWQLGRLARAPKDQRIRLVVIPDLALLSLPAARACVALMGAEVAYLERHGQDMIWVPNYCWLAGCTLSDVYQVSPHLLDRFALRLPEPGDASTDRVTDILAWLTTPPSVNHHGMPALSPDVRRRLQEAAHHRPALDEGVVAHILKYFSGVPHSGSRREIALARLVIAHAQLIKAKRVTTAHVDAVAALIGLKLENPGRKYLRFTPPPPVARADSVLEETSTLSNLASGSGSTTPLDGTPVYPPDTQETLPSMPLTGPYLEDTVPTDRETTSLRLKPPGYQANTASNGTIIGTERAISLHDLALVSTLLEAAKFQMVRHKYILKRAWNKPLTAIAPRDHHDISTWHALRGDQFVISVADLRAYRRAPIPKQILVLVLDYTCLCDCYWVEAVVPHLEWAYTERASICLIQVGAATATDKAALRAQQIIAPSILAGSIRSAFGVSPGQATPLAHGLDLAVRMLRRVLRNDRSMVRQARLVVLSDGRGNVPLKASQTGTVEWPVTREGIEDALQVAHGIRGLKNVEIFLLNPQPQQYPDLPIALAEALGVIPDPIRLKDMGGSS